MARGMSAEKTALAPPVWHGYRQAVPELLWKSAVNAFSMPLMTAESRTIRPSSRLWLRELLEKFSDPANTFADDVP